MGASETRIELRDGTTEVVGFFDDLFGVTHLPAREVVGRAIICSPIYSEFLKNNRREVMLGRELARHGYAVQRFHYRGTGNSFGPDSGLSIETMTKDASDAIVRLESLAGPGPVDVISTRLAALVAGQVTRPDSRTVLWEPVNDGKRYFRELTRAVLILAVKNGTGRTSQDLDHDLETNGSFDVAGFSIVKSLRDSAVATTISVAAGTAPSLIVQLGRTPELRKDIAAVAAVAEAAGRRATIEHLDFEEAWWFHQDVNLLRPEEGGLLDDAIVDLTTRWMTGATA